MSRHITIVCALSTFVACAPQEGKLSNNGLVLDIEVLDALTTQPLEIGVSGQLDETAFGPLLATEHGRELFSYLMICALDEEQSVRVASLGTEYVGGLGLATQWLQSSCDGSCQRWVTACILAHTNAFGESVVISPRGSHESLRWNDDIREKYSYEEAGYYGNLFLPKADRFASVCGGKGLVEEVFTGDDLFALQENFVAGRIHSAGSDEILFAGTCGPLNVTGLPGAELKVCSSRAGGYYQDCEIAVAEDDVPSGRSNEVITVFLAR